MTIAVEHCAVGFRLVEGRALNHHSDTVSAMRSKHTTAASSSSKAAFKVTIGPAPRSRREIERATRRADALVERAGKLAAKKQPSLAWLE